MSDTRISGLPVAAALTGTEILPLVQVGTTSAVTLAALKAFIDSGGTPVDGAFVNLSYTGTLTGGTASILGNVGVGGASQTNVVLRSVGNITGAVSGYGIRSAGTVLSDVTSGAYSVSTAPSTAAAAFTLGALFHYNADQGTFGAGSAVTAQYAFAAQATLIGAGTNIGFYGNIPAGTNRFNLYMAGTADNYMAGSVGVGATPFANTSLLIAKGATGGTAAYSILVQQSVQPDVTVQHHSFRTQVGTQAAPFTLTELSHFFANQATFGAGSAVTTQIGFSAAASLIGGVTNYGFYGNIPTGTGRYNLFMSGTADNYMSGKLGVGATPYPAVNLIVNKPLSGATTTYNVLSQTVVQSDVTTDAQLFRTQVDTQAAAFTLNTISHLACSQGTIGAGSTVNNQYGVFVSSNLVGATNNFAFYGNIPAGTNRFNFYAAGTADNFMQGALGLGGGAPAATSLYNSRPMTGSATSYGARFVGSVQSDVTNSAQMFSSGASTAAAAFTLTSLIHFAADQGTIGAGSTVNNQYGLYIAATLVGGANNFGVYSNLAVSGATRFNFYAAGTAPNRFVGETLVIGATGGLGYGTGAGGNIVQLTSRSTGVTLNKPTGQITLFSAAGLATWTVFTVTNSLVAFSDTVVVSVQGGASNGYLTNVINVANGSFAIAFATTGGVAVDAPNFNFTVIKGATA